MSNLSSRGRRLFIHKTGKQHREGGPNCCPNEIVYYFETIMGAFGKNLSTVYLSLSYHISTFDKNCKYLKEFIKIATL